MQELLKELRDRLTTILLEERAVSSDDITAAIENKYRVLITYDDETEKHQTGPRLIEPYVYGMSSAGNDVIRAFQYYGSTRRGVPKYKLFRVDRIKSWVPKENSHFVAEPNKVGVSAPKYNENGDGSMSMIFAQVSFGSNNNQVTTQTTQRDDWESPLDKVKRERQMKQQNIERQLGNKININKQGAVQTKSLEKELDQDKGSLEKDIDDKLGINSTDNNRGAVSVGNNRYDYDSKSKEEKHDDEIQRRRDRRWEKAADSRPLWRKGSENDTLQQDDAE